MSTPTQLHPLLKRQLQTLAKQSPDGKVSSQHLIAAINQKYIDDDVARRRLERSLTVTSSELGEMYEEAKKDKHAAEASSLSKSMFLANMSHEIRTPLNGVLGFASMLLTTDLTETQNEYLNIIQSSGKTLLFLLNDILDLSKIESGAISLEIISFNLQNVVESCVDLFRGQLTNENVDMNTYIDPSLACSYMGDPERLTQIITNFVSNALKFTSEGSVGIEVLALPRTGTSSHPIEIRISDTGIGIAEDKQALIFESFTQADSSTTREYGGTGLGLAISKHLTSLMGGTISLESTPGEGSTFILRLSLEEAPDNAGTILSNLDVTNLKGKRALVVDDISLNRRYFKAQLEDYGMVCDTVASAEAALQYLDKMGPPLDIIITDHLMPNMDGLELIKLLKSREDARDIPIILSSSSGAPKARYANAAYDGLVSKPVVQKHLLSKLNELTGDTCEADALVLDTPPTSSVETPTAPIHKTRILLAEDNYVNQTLIIQALDKEKYIIDGVANGQEALHAAKTLNYDIVLMDIRMPIMGGIEAAAAIRALDGPAANIPIIALTANSMQGDKEKYLECGMDDYLAKPLDLKALRTLVQKWSDKASQSNVSSLLPEQSALSA